VGDEQLARFESLRKLVDEASEALESMRDIAFSGLNSVDNDSSLQAEQLQRIQHYAGTAVDALTQASEVARHARSYQAQAHQKNAGNRPQ
jgi:uncharacterized protein YgfB (UPF0149 family)